MAWLQVHIAAEELEYWFREGLVLTWGNPAHPPDLKQLVIDIARSVLSKVDLCRLALARMVMADRASNIYIDVYIPIQLSPTCELSSLGLLICRESGSRAAVCYPPGGRGLEPGTSL